MNELRVRLAWIEKPFLRNGEPVRLTPPETEGEAAARAETEQRLKDDAQMASTDPIGFIVAAIGHVLTEQQKQALESAYGLGGVKRMGFRQIAEKMAVTQDRARGLAAKSLVKLRRNRQGGAMATAPKAVMEDGSAAAMTVLENGNGVVRAAEVTGKIRNLDPMFRLCANTYRDVYWWLGETCETAGDDWMVPERFLAHGGAPAYK